MEPGVLLHLTMSVAEGAGEEAPCLMSVAAEEVVVRLMSEAAEEAAVPLKLEVMEEVLVATRFCWLEATEEVLVATRLCWSEATEEGAVECWPLEAEVVVCSLPAEGERVACSWEATEAGRQLALSVGEGVPV